MVDVSNICIRCRRTSYDFNNSYWSNDKVYYAIRSSLSESAPCFNWRCGRCPYQFEIERYVDLKIIEEQEFYAKRL